MKTAIIAIIAALAVAFVLYPTATTIYSSISTVNKVLGAAK